jgi:molybdopterin molybdotransferase
VSTLAANGRVLAEAQVSGMNVPAADNTQMDGYAVRAADCASGSASCRIAAHPGRPCGQPLQPGRRRASSPAP